VLFLTRYPVEGASSRYRVFQYIPLLEAMGVACEVQSLMDKRLYALTFSSGRTGQKAWATIKAAFRRIRAVARHRAYDAIYMQRELLPFGPPFLERWLKRRGAVLLFDYDDALFISMPSRYNPVATLLRSPQKVHQIFGLVDLVVAGNDWLRDQARKEGAKAITVEVAEDTGRIPMHPAHTNERPVTIGWLGSTSTVKYLRLIEPVLVQIARRYPLVRWEIVGGGPFEMPGVPWRNGEWSFQEELDALRRFDVGLMPLPDDDWARGKSGGKARTYMAAGVVPVCSAIGYNRELLVHGVTGMLCSTQEEWLAALCTVIEDAALRQAIAERARAEVELRFSPLCQAEKLRDALSLALGAAPTNLVDRGVSS
jgi:glycosyltransferase involved in cell wall biosynthesis